MITDQYMDGAWWQYKWYTVTFDYTQWTPDVHRWFRENCGKYRSSPISGTNDVSYMFRDEADAIAFKLKYLEHCK